MPRSSILMYVRSKSHRSASFSCENPNDSRRLRISSARGLSSKPWVSFIYIYNPAEDNKSTDNPSHSSDFRNFFIAYSRKDRR